MRYGTILDPGAALVSRVFEVGVYVEFDPDEIDELLDILTFLSEFAKEKVVDANDLPWIKFGDGRLPFGLFFLKAFNHRVSGVPLEGPISIQFDIGDPVHRLAFFAYREYLKREDTVIDEAVRTVFDLMLPLYKPPSETLQ